MPHAQAIPSSSAPSPSAPGPAVAARPCRPVPPGDPSPDPALEAERLALRLAGHLPLTRRGCDVQQASLAIAGSVARLVASGELPFQAARDLLPLLRELDVLNALGRPPAAFAVKLDAALVALGPFLNPVAGDAGLRPRRLASPGTLAAWRQAQADAAALAQAGHAPADVTLSPCNPVAEAAAGLLARASTAAAGDPVRQDMQRQLAAGALVLAANLGGTDMPARVRAAVRGFVARLADALAGRTAPLDAPGALLAALTTVVHTLDDCLCGSAHGCKDALLAVCLDIGTLREAADGT